MLRRQERLELRCQLREQRPSLDEQIDHGQPDAFVLVPEVLLEDRQQDRHRAARISPAISPRPPGPPGRRSCEPLEDGAMHLIARRGADTPGSRRPARERSTSLSAEAAINGAIAAVPIRPSAREASRRIRSLLSPSRGIRSGMAAAGVGPDSPQGHDRPRPARSPSAPSAGRAVPRPRACRWPPAPGRTDNPGATLPVRWPPIIGPQGLDERGNGRCRVGPQCGDRVEDRQTHLAVLLLHQQVDHRRATPCVARSGRRSEAWSPRSRRTSTFLACRFSISDSARSGVGPSWAVAARGQRPAEGDRQECPDQVAKSTIGLLHDASSG